MNRLVLLCSMIVVLSSAVISEAAFLLNVKSGEVSFIRKGTSERKTTIDSITLESGDSLFLANEHQASITLEKNSKLLFKGPLVAVVTNDNSALKVALDEGQVFLDRNLPYEYSSIQIVSKGYSFQPLGTAAAVKIAKNSHPATAVIRGKMKMQSPTGESIIVEEGNFGSLDQNGNLISGKLTKDAYDALLAWGNIKPDNGTVQTIDSVAKAPVAVSPLPTNQPAQLAVDSTPVMQPATPAPNTSQPAVQATGSQVGQTGDQGTQKIEVEKAAKGVDASGGGATAAPSKPTWEINAGTATVNNQQWTRLAVGVDVPIWKFGVFFDVELFINDQGKISDKGWNFKDDWFDAVTRKIRYIRFGKEEDPLFIKFGGLSSVTLGYGFIVDRFTNMLHYPDQKLLGLQFDLNDVGPIGITLQTLVADFKDFKDDGGVVAARLAFAPLKMSEIPIIKGITIGGTYAVDINQFAPARKWKIADTTSLMAYHDERKLYDSIEAVERTIRITGKNPLQDSVKYAKEKKTSESTDQFGLIGADVGVPLIRSTLVSLDLYGQGGIREDLEHGWGIGAPGVSLKVSKFWASVEYRHIEGMFTPGYFGMYYLDERLQRDPTIVTKEQTLVDDNLNGIFGRLGFNVANIVTIDGSYQYMVGSEDANKDQRFEITSSIGDLIIQKIPRLSKAQIYYQKSRIGSTVVGKNLNTNENEYDAFFDKTPNMYWGYKVGIGITQGASLVFDSRYGFKRGGADGFKMLPDNNISIQTSITF
jgi:hypothetical protein